MNLNFFRPNESLLSAGIASRLNAYADAVNISYTDFQSGLISTTNGALLFNNGTLHPITCGAGEEPLTIILVDENNAYFSLRDSDDNLALCSYNLASHSFTAIPITNNVPLGSNTLFESGYVITGNGTQVSVYRPNFNNDGSIQFDDVFSTETNRYGFLSVLGDTSNQDFNRINVLTQFSNGTVVLSTIGDGFENQQFLPPVEPIVSEHYDYYSGVQFVQTEDELVVANNETSFQSINVSMAPSDQVIFPEYYFHNYDDYSNFQSNFIPPVFVIRSEDGSSRLHFIDGDASEAITWVVRDIPFDVFDIDFVTDSNDASNSSSLIQLRGIQDGRFQHQVVTLPDIYI